MNLQDDAHKGFGQPFKGTYNHFEAGDPLLAGKWAWLISCAIAGSQRVRITILCAARQSRLFVGRLRGKKMPGELQVV